MASNFNLTDESQQIIHLNVGGKRFSTSYSTLSWCPDSFFSALLSGRIPVLRDENSAIFIDRDPKLFNIILNYLRTKEIDLKNVDITILRHEAEFYNLQPLIARLLLCEEMNESSCCGNVLFYGYLPTTEPPENVIKPKVDEKPPVVASSSTTQPNVPSQSSSAMTNTTTPSAARPGQIVRAHSRNSSWDLRVSYNGVGRKDGRHNRNSSADLNKYLKNDLNVIFNQSCSTEAIKDPLIEEQVKVQIIKAHHNCIALAHTHYVTVFQLKDSFGWQLIFKSPFIEAPIERISINAKISIGNSDQQVCKMLAISYDSQIRLWSLTESGQKTDIGIFNLLVRVEYLFFINTQLVALSSTGKIGVWHALTQHFQIQDLGSKILCFDFAGSFLLLGSNNGKIYYIDMQKFPLRMKDNDLLVTELYKDPSGDQITALSVYLTPKTTSLQGNWIEIAYGTKNGSIRVIVQHPETVGTQLFQSFSVHTNQIVKVTLSEKYLISVCSEYNHVRTWKVIRFRGMISTQPGSNPKASFKIVSLEATESSSSYIAGNDFGPFGEQDDEQIFLQKVIPETDQLYIRFASNGKRICVIKSVDGSPISSFCVHECEGNSRLLGSRPRRFVLTGHNNGKVQMWDLTTALELVKKGDFSQLTEGGPSKSELLKLLDQCDLTNSHTSTPSSTPSMFNLLNSGNLLRTKLKTSNLIFLNNYLSGNE